MTKMIGIITGILTIVGSVVLVLLELDTRHASAESLEVVAQNQQQLYQKFEKRSIVDDFRDARREVYDLRRIVRKNPNDQYLKDRLREAEEEYERLKGKIDAQ